MNSELKEGVIYKARIVDQVVTEPAGEDGLVMTLVLTVRILANSRTTMTRAGPTLECDEQERDVLIRIVGDDEDSLRMAIKDLERLGFADDDVSRLHPDHPNAHRLIDKNVHVRCKAGRNGGMFWNLAWPRSKAAARRDSAENLRDQTEGGCGTRQGRQTANQREWQGRLRRFRCGEHKQPELGVLKMNITTLPHMCSGFSADSMSYVPPQAGGTLGAPARTTTATGIRTQAWGSPSPKTAKSCSIAGSVARPTPFSKPLA